MGNALTTTPNSTPVRKTTLALSPQLTGLLDSERNPKAVAQEIANSPALLDEARCALPALIARASRKAGVEGVKQVVGSRFVTYPQPPRSEAEWVVWWADWIHVCEDVSLASLEAGMRAYVALPDSEFLPKPGRLRELAFTSPCRSAGRVYRAQLAISAAESAAAARAAPPKADPDAVQAMLAEFLGKSKATKVAR